jgi:hypothetical protein
VLRLGQVIEIFDPRTQPQKPKWHICVCERRLLFLRINSRALWRPHHLLVMSQNPFLKHDSYVELRQLFHFGPNAVATAMRLRRNPLGVLNKSEAYALAVAAQRAVTLSQEYRDLVWENLTTSYP